MLFLGHLLKAIGLIIAAVALANAAGMLINSLTGAEELRSYAYFALPLALAGCVPGGALYVVGRRMVRNHTPL